MYCEEKYLWRNTVLEWWNSLFGEVVCGIVLLEVTFFGGEIICFYILHIFFFSFSFHCFPLYQNLPCLQGAVMLWFSNKAGLNVVPGVWQLLELQYIFVKGHVYCILQGDLLWWQKNSLLLHIAPPTFPQLLNVYPLPNPHYMRGLVLLWFFLWHKTCSAWPLCFVW